MRLIPRVSLRSVLRAAPACSSGAVLSEQDRMEQWNSQEGVGNRYAISLLGILSSGLLSILIASLFPSPWKAIGKGQKCPLRIHWPLSTGHWPLFFAPRSTSGVRLCADSSPLATAIHRQPNWERANGARSRRSPSP